MKLVTGIEAIQSGKPWKHKNDDNWIDKTDTIGYLTTQGLLKKDFIIKEEPREFWIDTSTGRSYSVETEEKVCGHWIRVREVEK